MTADNKAIPRRFIDEVWNKGNLAVIDEIVARDHINHDPSAAAFGQGAEAARRFATVYRSAFPDVRLRIDDQIAEGDKVATRWSASGTHTGELMGIPATGKRTTVTGTLVDRISGGKIVETWGNWDQLGLLQQLGAVPPMAAAEEKLETPAGT